jgi:transcriptional regulator with XRE-family HTH domain
VDSEIGARSYKGATERGGHVSGQIGLELQRIREERGLSVEELARKSGISATTIRVMERGTREVSEDTIAKLAKPLGLTFEEVWSLQRRRG